MKNIAIFWFRRDLRLNDNKGLFFALSENENVLPIFIFDPEILSQLQKNDPRVQFIFETIGGLNILLAKKGKRIHLFHEKPISIFEKLLKKYAITIVYTNHDYEPYALKRDLEVATFLKKNNIAFKTYKDQVIFEKNEIVKADSNPYLVYTPYKLSLIHI